MNQQTHRLPQGGLIDRRKPLRFQFNGRNLQGFSGDTLASALIANGIHLVARSFKYHRPRGIFSAGAEEPNALVQLETGSRTEPNIRATQIELYDGLTAASQHCWPTVNTDFGAINNLLSRFLPAGFYYKTFMWPPSWWLKYEHWIRKMAGLGVSPRDPDPDCYEHRHAHCDVLIVGSGPAGLGAALAAARAGARVILADEGIRAGGSLLYETTAIDGLPAAKWAARALAELSAHPEFIILTRSTVSGYFDHNFLTATETVSPATPITPRQRLWKIRARRVVLATGAIERPLVFADNDRPGNMLASAARAYINRYGVRPGNRAVIFTNNDSAYLAAIDLQRVGTQVVTIIDARPAAGNRVAALARNASIRTMHGHVVARAHGTRHISAVDISRHENGQTTGATECLDCDLLCVSGGWSPAVHLFSQSKGRLRYDDKLTAFVPDVSTQAEQSAGAARGIYGLADCIADGYAAGSQAAVACGLKPPEPLTRPLVDQQEPGALLPLWKVEAAHIRHAKSFVDLQNDVTTADIVLAAREGYVSVEHLKRYTTLGMGTDQGKTSNINGLAILAEINAAQIPEVGTTTFRPPYTPVTLGAIAGTEIGAHFSPVRTSAMHAWHAKSGAQFINAGLWKRPRLYHRAEETELETINREVLAVRRSVGLVDVSTLGKIDIKGRDACEFLERIYINRWRSLAVGKARYGLMLREDGMAFDDGTTTRIGDEHYLMTTTTANAVRVMSTLEYWLQVHWRDLDVRLTSVTDQWAAMALAGPGARQVLAAVTSNDVGNDTLPHMGYREMNIAGSPARVFRISFSGERAYEINVPADYGLTVWEALLAAGQSLGITPYGTEAMAVLRIEKGHAAAMELDGRTTPDDLGLAKMIAADKDFIGKRSLSRPGLVAADRRQLVGLIPVNRRTSIPRGSQLTLQPDKPHPVPMIGHVTSTCYSPTLEHPIALALLSGGRARIGQRVHALSPLTGDRVEVEVTSHVFFDAEGSRLRG
ncbi:MAG: sarcosine oxidase subunit alpha family protein [Burkholderiales bacterium]